MNTSDRFLLTNVLLDRHTGLHNELQHRNLFSLDYAAEWLYAVGQNDCGLYFTACAELNYSDTPRVTSVLFYRHPTSQAYPIKTVVVIQPPVRPFLFVHDSIFTMPDERKKSKAIVTSNTNWTAVSDKPWIKINKGIESENSDTIIFTTEENRNFIARTGYITISGEGVEDRVITISQEKHLPLSLSHSKINFQTEPQSDVLVEVSADTSWLATTDQVWLTIAQTDSSMYITVDTNFFRIDRTAIITVNDKNGNSQKIEIIQQGDFDGKDYFYAPTNRCFDTIDLYIIEAMEWDLAITSTLRWEATVGDDWLSISPNNGLGQTVYFNLKATNNPATSDRYTTLSFFVKGNKQHTCIVKQRGIEPVDTIILDEYRMILDPDINSIGKIRVFLNPELTVSFDQDWLSAEYIDHYIVATARSENKNSEERTANITVTNSIGNKKIITVTQRVSQKNRFYAIYQNDTISSTYQKQTLSSFAIRSYSPWKAKVSDDWLSVSPMNGLGDPNLTFINYNISFEENTRAATRYSTLRFSSNDVVRHVYVIEQTGSNPFLTVSSYSEQISAEGDSIYIAIESNAEWTAVSNQAWLTVTSINDTIKLCVTENFIAEERSATVIISAERMKDQEISITQMKGVVAPTENVETHNKEKYTIYPNPSRKFFSFTPAEECKICIHSVLGDLLECNELKDGNKMEHNLPPGFYVVEIFTNRGKKIETLVVK